MVLRPRAHCRGQAKRVLVSTAAAALWISALSTPGSICALGSQDSMCHQRSRKGGGCSRGSTEQGEQIFGYQAVYQNSQLCRNPTKAKSQQMSSSSSCNTAGPGLGAGCTVLRENKNKIQSWKFKAHFNHIFFSSWKTALVNL